MSTERRFATGEWYAVAGDAVTVVLPAAERERVAVLWDLADGGGTADVLLDALVGGGLSGLTHFALVGEQDGTTRVIVRGAPTASVTTQAGVQTVAAATGTAWNEQVLTGVTGVRVDLGGTDPADLVLTPGLARVSVLEVGVRSSVETSVAGTPAAAIAEPTPEPIPEQVPGPAPVPEPPHEQPVVEEPAVEEPVRPADEPEPMHEEPAAEEPVAEQPVAEEPAPEQPSVPQVFDPAPGLPGDDQDADLAPSTPIGAEPMSFGQPDADSWPTGENPVVDEDWSDRDGQTVIGAPTPDFDRPPIPGQEMAPDVVSRPVATLVFSTGDVVDVDRTVLIGRAPEARQFASHDQPRAVTVSSPNQEISSTHLEIRPGAGADHGSAIATDLGSTNGTMLVQPGLSPEELKPGIAVSLIPGAVLDLGDGVTIQVTNP